MFINLGFLLLIVLLSGSTGGTANVSRNLTESLTQVSSKTGLAEKHGLALPVVVRASSQSSKSRRASRKTRRHRSSNMTTQQNNSATTQQEKSIEDILTDATLWGKDFPSALAALPAFSQAGEREVAIFPDRIVGRTKQQQRAQAAPRAARLNLTLSRTQRLIPRSTKLLSVMGQGRISLTAEVILFPDDKSYRIAATNASAQFLAPDVTIETVRQRLGKEEKTTTEVLDDGTERRPIILTLHHYAGSSIIFVESDVNPNIGSVDRVFLNAPQISATIF
ncbi:MAG: hypothetical protein WCB68_21040 [Pyrinomonadaceae bacterium]